MKSAGYKPEAVAEFWRTARDTKALPYSHANFDKRLEKIGKLLETENINIKN